MSRDRRLWYTCANLIVCCAICVDPLTLLFFYHNLPEFVNTLTSIPFLCVDSGSWILNNPTDCATVCGVAEGSGKPGTATCQPGQHCKPPAPVLQCPKTEPCGKFVVEIFIPKLYDLWRYLYQNYMTCGDIYTKAI